MALIRKILPRTLCILISKRTRPCSLNTSLVTYHIIIYTHKTQDQSVVNRKTSCVMSIIPSFRAGFVQKMYLMTKIKLFSVTSVNFGFIFSVTILIIWIIDIYKTVINPCIECCSSIFPFNSLSSNKNILTCCTSTDSDSNFIQLKELENDHNSSLLLNLHQI